MGTITRIRQWTPYVFVVFAIFFVVFMILSDNISNLATSGGENPQTAAIAKVNGDKIYYKDYEEMVRARIEQMRNDPQNQGRDIDEQQVRNQVWEELLRENLIIQAGQKLGITISNEEILDILIDNPPDYLKQSFTDTTGFFNKDLYLKIITNPETIVNYVGQDPAQLDQATRDKLINDFRNQLIVITDYLRIQKINEALVNTLNAAYAVSSPTYIEKKFITDNSSADANFIFINQATIPDSLITISQEELKAYYEKNKQNFKVKNERKLKTLLFPVVASLEDSVRNNKRIENITQEITNAPTLQQRDSIFTQKMNEYAGTENDWQMLQDINPQIASILANVPDNDVTGPIALPDGVHFYRVDGRRSGEQEVVKASHILIAFNDNKDSAKKVADKVLKETNLMNFATQAIKYSDDKGSGAQGGELGYFGRGRMVPEFEKAAFGAKINSIVGPVESQFGYHIIMVTDKKSEELKYSDIAFTTTISNNTKNKIKRDALAAMQQIQEGTNIDTLATRLKIQVTETPFQTSDKPVYGSMYITNKMFEGKVGDVLEPKEINNGTYVIVAQISGAHKAGIGSFSDDSLQIYQKLLKIKKLDVVKKQIDEIYNIVKSNPTLEGYEGELPYNARVTTMNIKDNGSFPNITTDYAGSTYAFKLPTNKINEPVRSDNGYFIFEIKNKQIPNAEQAKNATDVTKQNYTRNLFETWFTNFRNTSKIEDLRSKFYQEY